ncbi:MAG: ABC transporter substrate-binding protein, partial [Candidatus Bathyarchaeia archaeon]
MSKKGITKTTLALILIVIVLLVALAGLTAYFMTREVPPTPTPTLLPSPTVSPTPTPKPTPTPVAAPEFVRENKLVIEAGATYQWLDPHVSYYQYDYWILWHTVETLVWYKRESATEVIPWLAESFEEINPTTYEFKLRKGITFQDGTPFNATAVWFSLNRLLVMDATDGTGGHGGQAGWIVQQLLDPDGEYFTCMGAEPAYDEAWVQSVLDLNFVEIVDDYTVRLHLATPTTQLLPILAGPWCAIVSPTETIRKDYEYKGWNFAAEQQPRYDYKKYFLHMAGNGDTYFNLPEKGWTFGTGPYHVVSVDPTTYKIVLKAYDKYWGGPDKMNLPPAGKKRIETIEFIYQPSFTTRLLDLKQGKATGIGVAEADIFQVVDRDTWINQGVLKSIIPDVTVHGVFPTLNTWWFAFNTNVTLPDGSFRSWQPFADWRMRMAVACSVNMTHANIYVNNRLSRLAVNIIPPGTYPEGSHNPNVKPMFSFNLDKVKELIKDMYEHPMTSATHDMYFYNGTKIPPGVVDNTFSASKPQVVELYVQSGWTTAIQILSTMVENLNSIARSVTGSRVALQFRVVIVPGGQQYTLAARHLI